jgi:RNA repair, ligase-Pnkp-associating, region of Hen1
MNIIYTDANLPDFAKACADDTELVLLRHDAFAADYQEDERYSAMLLTITNTKSPATDVGYLLHKNPRRLQSFDLSFGKVHVFYPEASAERCNSPLFKRAEKFPKSSTHIIGGSPDGRLIIPTELFSLGCEQLWRL